MTTNTNVHNSLGVCLAEKGDLDQARRAFETVCRNHPDGCFGPVQFGLDRPSSKEIETAQANFEKAWSADKKHI